MNAPGHHPAPLLPALRNVAHNPLVLLRQWNWKAAALSASIRGTLFLLANRHAGQGQAAKAMAVEMAFATVAAGVAGAFTQQLRHARPRLWTGVVLLLGVPLALLLAQAAVHHLAGTPRLRSGLLWSFVFASLASAFNWFAMDRGIFLTGGQQGFWQDLSAFPRLAWQAATGPWQAQAESRPDEAAPRDDAAVL